MRHTEFGCGRRAGIGFLHMQRTDLEARPRQRVPVAVNGKLDKLGHSHQPLLDSHVQLVSLLDHRYVMVHRAL